MPTRTAFIVCPTCNLVVAQIREEGISNTTKVADEPCERCKRKEELRRARLAAESHDALDDAEKRGR